jgi:L-alanine-DL-glutamate epimerase-like enolase superfamily enzyme
MVAVGERLFPDAPKPKDGFIEIPDRPGLGLILDDAAYKETQVALN